MTTAMSIGTVEAHLRADHGVTDPPVGELEQRALHAAAHQVATADHLHPEALWTSPRLTTIRTP